MPNLKQHMAESQKRTGKTFEKLHIWMDMWDGRNHRELNHNLRNITYLKRNFKKYGLSKGEVIKEFIHHIVMDWQETERKWNRY